jgi:hypothetical protein
MTKSDQATYITTFCNFAHRLKDGKPVEHECYIIRPNMLQMECAHGASVCLEHMKQTGEAFHTGRRMRYGVKRTTLALPLVALIFLAAALEPASAQQKQVYCTSYANGQVVCRQGAQQTNCQTYANGTVVCR